MTNTYNHAKVELDILVNSSTDPDNRPIIEPFIPELLALAEKFGKSGQSGGSAPYVASALSHAVKHICLQQPICDITGAEDEWVNVADMSDGDDPIYQNKRAGAIFKNKDGQSWYLDAIIWITQTGSTWGGLAILPNGEKISGHQYIKSFPFEPKTFIIDVTEKEVAKDDWEFYINDETKLIKVFEYYNNPPKI